MLCEANTYAYDTSEARKYCLDSRGHNVIRVNGMGQNRRASYKWDTSMLFVKANATLTVGDDMDVVEGIYDEQFGDGSVKVIHKRKLIMWKKSASPVYIAVDDLSSETENEYEAMWHYDVKEAEIKEGKFISEEITQFVCGDTGDMRIASGELEPEMQGWICRSSRQHSEEPIPTFIHKVKGSNVRTVNVFALHENGACPVEDVKLDNGILTLVFSDGNKDAVKL